MHILRETAGSSSSSRRRRRTFLASASIRKTPTLEKLQHQKDSAPPTVHNLSHQNFCSFKFWPHDHHHHHYCNLHFHYDDHLGYDHHHNDHLIIITRITKLVIIKRWILLGASLVEPWMRPLAKEEHWWSSSSSSSHFVQTWYLSSLLHYNKLLGKDYHTENA